MSHQLEVENASTRGVDEALLASGVRMPVDVVANAHEIGPTTRDDTKKGRDRSEEILPPPLAKRVLVALDAADGGLVTLEELIDAAYGDREDGGPLHAVSILRSTILRLRGIGAKIDAVKGYRVLSRSRAGLSRQELAVVNAIDASRGIGGRETIAAAVGIAPHNVSVVIVKLKAKGIDVEALAGYRLRKPGIVAGVVPFRRPEPRPATIVRQRGVEADALRVLAVLDRAGGRPMTADDIHSIAFSHRVDGGPKNGIAKALSWLEDRGADIRRVHRYYLPTTRRCTVTRPTNVRVLEAIRAGHHEIEAIAVAAGMTEGAVKTAVAKMKSIDRYEIESVSGYVLHIASFDPIHQIAA